MTIYGKKISRYGFPSCHYRLLSLFPSVFICSPSLLLYWDCWLSQAHPPYTNPSHPNACTQLKHRQKVIQNYWKIRKTWFSFISQELPHRAPGMSHGSLLLRHWHLKPVNPKPEGSLQNDRPWRIWATMLTGDSTFISNRRLLVPYRLGFHRNLKPNHC